MKLSYVLNAVACLGVASCHTIFLNLAVEGKLNGIGVGIRDPVYDGPIQDVTSNFVACNGDKPGGQQATRSSNVVIDVKAGEKVTAIWRKSQTSSPREADGVVDPSHKGPVMAYMKKVTDALSDPGYGAGWFKISEAGLKNGKWATEDLIAASGNQTITIPSCIAPGQYLLRPELIALHGAGSRGGAQLYMECAQINVIGGSGTKTPATVSLPGAYKATDPGILFNLFSTPPPQNYTIPGPSAFTC